MILPHISNKLYLLCHAFILHPILCVTFGRELTLHSDCGRQIRVLSGEKLRFLVIPGDRAYYNLYFQELMKHLPSTVPVVAAVSQNMRDAVKASGWLEGRLNDQSISGVFYMPEVYQALTNEVMQRLKLSRSTAHEPPETKG